MGGGGAGGAEAPLSENLRGLSPPRFGPENIGNATENWFGKIFRLVIVYKWSRLAKYYFLGSFEQLHPDFSEHLEELQRSCFGTDIDCGRLGHQLYHVHNAVKTLPEVRRAGDKYKNHLGSFQQNSCHRNASRRGPQTATNKLYNFDIYTCGIGDYRAQAFFPAPPKNLS